MRSGSSSAANDAEPKSIAMQAARRGPWTKQHLRHAESANFKTLLQPRESFTSPTPANFKTYFVNFTDEDHFVGTYPFVTYHSFRSSRQVMVGPFRPQRSRDATVPLECSMLGVVQEVPKTLATPTSARHI